MTTATLLGFAVLAIPAQAESIDVDYSLTGVGNVVAATDTTLTLQALADGSITSTNAALNASWNPVSYSDTSVLDLNTGALNGTFTMVFADGATLTGSLSEDDSAVDASPTQTGPFTQTLTFTGGTGEFATATGFASGTGFVGTTGFTVSGTGTVSTSAVPEPASLALLGAGLASVVASKLRNRTGKR
jgi:hypothetical protein